MERIAGADIAVDANGAGKDGFQGDLPGIHAATEVTPRFLNRTIQEEPCTLVEKTGQSLDPNRTDQLYRGLIAMQIESALLNPVARVASGWAYPFYAVAESVVTPGLIIAVGFNGGIWRSTDYGANWTQVTPFGSYTGTFRAVRELDNGIDWVIAGQNGEIQHSNNAGLSWSHKSALGYGGDFYAIAFCPDETNNIVFVGTNGEIRTTADIDAGVITKRTQATAGSFTGTFSAATYDYATGLYVIAGTNGEIQTSPDGVNWTKRTQAGGYTGTFTGAVPKANNGVILVGSAGEIQLSTNLTSWARIPSPMPAAMNFNAVCYGGSVDVDNVESKAAYVAVGNDGSVAFSIDGTRWRTCRRRQLPQHLYGVTGSGLGHRFTMVGNTGIIRQSQVF